METKDPIIKALPEITQAFGRSGKRVFTPAEIRQFMNDGRKSWRLGSISLQQFIQALTTTSLLKEAKLDFPNRPAHRFIWRAVTTFELVRSVNEESYFSHQSALHLHKLTDELPKTIFLNIEQPKKAGGGTLTQAGIDLAFKRKCRTTKNSARHMDQIIYILNGANTGKLGVIEMQAPEGSNCIRVTNIERTLIDAVVRPVYAGGVFEVANAYQAARSKVSVQRIAEYLRKLNYTYPYHQSIGYFMQRAGYEVAELDMMRQFHMEHDFYLDYHMKKPAYNRGWKLFVPKDLDA